MIYILDGNRNFITEYLKLAGLRCGYSRLKDFSKEQEKNLSDNDFPEGKRPGVCCSEVWTDEKGAYCYTIKRLQGGYWGLLSAKGEAFKPPAGSSLLIPYEVHKELIIEAIRKTAIEYQ